jgi:hypothetical protein
MNVEFFTLNFPYAVSPSSPPSAASSRSSSACRDCPCNFLHIQRCSMVWWCPFTLSTWSSPSLAKACKPQPETWIGVARGYCRYSAMESLLYPSISSEYTIYDISQKYEVAWWFAHNRGEWAVAVAQKLVYARQLLEGGNGEEGGVKVSGRWIIW